MPYNKQLTNLDRREISNFGFGSLSLGGYVSLSLSLIFPGMTSLSFSK